MKTYTITTGRSRLETEWKRREITWPQLCAKLTKAKRTSESVAEYKAMTKTQK